MYLGIDLGTSEVKLLLVDEDQRRIGTEARALTVQRPHPGWSEQDPHAWWQAVSDGVAALRARHPRAWAALRGIGLSGQMHGAVLLDDGGAVLRPAMLWNDLRADAQCGQLERQAPDARAITGNLAMPGFTAPKLLWVATHERELFGRIAKVLLPKDYLRYRLSGEYASDMSDASGTLWLDVARRDWSDTMLAATGLTRRHMPRLVEGSDAAGQLDRALARAWGIDGPVVIAGGAGDNAASAIGMGVIAPQQGMLSLGTSGVLFAPAASFQPLPEQAVHTFCHALPGQWHQMGVMLSAASCLRWATQLTGAGDEAALLRETEAALPDGAAAADAPLFLPYLAGERTPHNDARARGVWFGFGPDTGRAQLAYSVLEGVAFGLRDNYLAMQAAGCALEQASLVGGGSKSRYWAQLLANALNLPLTLHEESSVGAALGAARLAMLAVDPARSAAHVCAPPAVLDTIAPQPAAHAAMLPRYARFRALYKNCKPLY